MEDVVTKSTKDDVLTDLLYVDDMFLMNETISGFRNKFKIWKETFENTGLKADHEKTKIILVSEKITRDGLSKGKGTIMGLKCLLSFLCSIL